MTLLRRSAPMAGAVPDPVAGAVLDRDAEPTDPEAEPTSEAEPTGAEPTLRRLTDRTAGSEPIAMGFARGVLAPIGYDSPCGCIANAKRRSEIKGSGAKKKALLRASLNLLGEKTIHTPSGA